MQSGEKWHCSVSKCCLPSTSPHELTLDPWPRNQGFLPTVFPSGREKPLPTTWEKLGNPRVSRNSTQTGIQRTFLQDLQVYISICLFFLSNPSSFQVRKGAGVYWWVRYVAKLMCKWNQSCALTGKCLGEHQTVSQTHRPSAARGGGFGQTQFPKSTESGTIQEQCC